MHSFQIVALMPQIHIYINFEYLLQRERESEKFKKVGGSMVQEQVFLKGEADH